LRDSGVGSKVTVIEGDAIQTLRSIEDQGPFDGIFIDGNKGAYSQYLDWAERNLSVGALVIADNVFLAGSTFKDPGSDGRWSASVVQGMRDLISRLLDPEKYEACLLPTSEGLLIARKKF
jgi:predicted O-methyltransferase YrrM